MPDVYVAQGHGRRPNGTFDPGATDGTHNEQRDSKPVAECPGEPGFECSDAILARGLCQRCYQRNWWRDLPEEEKDKKSKQHRRWRKENEDQRREYDRRYHDEHRDEKLEYKRRHYEAHKSEERERVRRWREANPEAWAETQRRYNEANLDKRAEKERRRRARKHDVLHVPFTVAELVARLSMFAGCWVCGSRADAVDHVKPLAAGGPHCLANLRPICTPCNSSKAAQWPYVEVA